MKRANDSTSREDRRKALLAAAAKAPREVRSFCSVLRFTGCRISEALALTAKSIDLFAKMVVIESLKKRRDEISSSQSRQDGLARS
jgi:integrase